jgi:hypothetical protein
MRVALAVGMLALVGAPIPAQAPAAPRLRVEREIFVHGGQSSCLAWSANGKWIASGGQCGEVLLLSAATGEVVRELEADAECRRVAFSPDSASLAVSGRQVTVWDVASGQLRGRFDSGSAGALAWSPDGLHLAFVAPDFVISIRAATDLDEVLRVDPAAKVAHLAWSPDARRLEAAAQTGLVVWVDLAIPGPPTKAFFPGRLHATMWLADGRSLRLDDNGVVYGLVGDPRFTCHQACGMAIGADGGLAVVWSADRMVGHDANGRRFDLDGGGVAAVGHGTAWLRAIDGELQFLADDVVRRRVPLLHRRALGDCVLTADGRYCAVASGRRDIEVFDTATGDRFALPAIATGTLLPNPAGPELLLWSRPKAGEPGAGLALAWWSPASLRAGHSDPVRRVELDEVPDRRDDPTPAVSPDGRWLAFGGAVFDLDLGGAPQWLVHKAGAKPCDGGRQVLVVHEVVRGIGGPGTPRGGNVELRSRDGASQRLGEKRVSATWAEVSPDGAHLAWTTKAQLEVVRVDTLATTARIDGSWDGVGAWVDGERLVLAGSAPERVDLCRGYRVVATLPVRSTPRYLAVDRSGRRMIVVLGDRVLVVRIEP